VWLSETVIKPSQTLLFTQHKRQTSMLEAGFKPVIPVIERQLWSAGIRIGQVIIIYMLIPTIVNSRQWLYCTVISNVCQRIFTCCRYLSSNGPADDMYLLWYAMLPQFTSFTNTPCSCSAFTNFVIDSAGPDSVQKLGPLWHATSISGGHSFLASSAPRPARHMSFVTCVTFITSTSSLYISQRQILLLLCHFLA